MEPAAKSRIVSVLLYLLRCGKQGVSRDFIYNEFEYNVPRTWRRDLDTLKQVSPHLNISTEDKRIYARLDLLDQNKDSENQNDFQQILDLINPVSTQNEQLIWHLKKTPDFKMDDHEVLTVLNAVFENKIIRFQYKNNTYSGYPLGICLFNERLYLFLHAAPHWYNFIYRLDFISSPGPASLISNQTDKKNAADLNQVRSFIKEKVSRAQNIFINLNRDQDIKIKFRFRLDEALLHSEIKDFEPLGFPDPEDRSVQDLAIYFSGYREAYQFMLRWLGCYSILSPEWIIDVFQNQVEEALDDIRG